jgi:hypothetical protein
MKRLLFNDMEIAGGCPYPPHPIEDERPISLIERYFQKLIRW